MRLERCFAFVDLCGFTAFTEHYGDEHTVAVLANFRAAIREVAARRGVRLTKWLGDGAMLSASEPEPVVAMIIELGARTDPEAVPLPIRAGLADGAVIMFEGDDYIGRAPNVASRLCDAAAPGEILATREVASRVPCWVEAGDLAPRDVPGFERPIDTCHLDVGRARSTVVDPLCGLVLPDVPGLITRFGPPEVPDPVAALVGPGGLPPSDAIHRFCSDACAAAWSARQRPGPTGSAERVAAPVAYSPEGRGAFD